MADEPHGDDDPQMREHALEDDLYTGAVHDGIRVIGHVHPGSLVRVDVVGDLRTGALDAIAFSVQAHCFVETGFCFFEVENFCDFHGGTLLILGRYLTSSLISQFKATLGTEFLQNLL